MELFGHLLKPNKNDNTYCIVECLDGVIRAAKVFHDKENNQIEVSRVRTTSQPSDIEELWKKINTLLQGRERETPLAILLPAQYARTVHTTAAVIRKDAKAPIAENELEDAIGNSLWKAFTRDRDYIAEQFQIADLSVELVDARVIGVKLDGYKVMSPVGFSARTLEFEFVLTYMPQFLAQTFREQFAEVNILLLEEIGVMWAQILAQGERNDFLFTPVFKEETMLVERNGASIRLTDTMRWGRANVYRVIENEFGVDELIARTIIKRFMNGEMGRLLAKRVSGLIANELKTILLSAQHHRQFATRSRLYVMLGMDISETTQRSAFTRQRGLGIPVTVFNRELLGELSGCSVQLEDGVEDEARHSLSMSALAFLLQTPDARLHKLAKRKVRWMNTSSS